MRERPAYLTSENANAFQAQSVAERYQLRSPYPDEVFDILLGLVVDTPRVVLDAGAGTGNLARRLVEQVERVDAVDISPAMIQQGKRLPNGQHPRLRWLTGAIEKIVLEPPYALIVAGESLHWMNWEVVFPRFAGALTPRGVVAFAYPIDDPVAWQAELDALVTRYSAIKNYQSFDLTEELEARRLFTKTGERETARISFTPSIEDYIASFHARSSLSLERISAEDAAAFDQQLRAIITPHSNDGMVELQVRGSVVWGRPMGGQSGA
jgi:SAM-dependent methyltransferase